MRISIGVDDFKELIQDVSSEGMHYFYCDKSMMIKEVIDDGSKILLFTRPRRFGKTLNMSMLSYFFGSKEALFNDLEISKYKHIMDTYRGQYPVISISFKGLKFTKYEDMFAGLEQIIRSAFELYESTFSKTSNKFDIYFNYAKKMTTVDLTKSLLLLSEHLRGHFGKPVLMLIDEYDAPLQTAYLNGYYDQAVDVFRNMFEDGLKTNKSLYKGVLTGITRIAQANLFSGLNHFRMYDIDSEKYSQYFGFTEDEVKNIIPEHSQDAKNWYNGYTFGKTTIYNPWSVLSFIDNNFYYKAYWVNTSENSLIQKSLTADKMADVEKLINGESIVLNIDNNLVLQHTEEYKNAFFNLLYTSGYLTSAGNGVRLDEKFVRIPNFEVKEFFETIVMKWFGRGGGTEFLMGLLDDLINGHIVDLQTKLQDLILTTMSFHDVGEQTQESFYHGFLLGMTLGLKDRYLVKSNRESGYGRYDIALYPIDPEKNPGIVIEIKMNKESPETAIMQIQDKEYATDLRQHGCHTLHLYGIHFDGKKVTTKLIRGK